MLFKGNSSKLELLIEKIQANKEGSSEEAGSLANEEVNVGGRGSSWDVGSDGRGGSLSPASSRATPTSAGEVTDVEAQATLGVTSQTPYQCAFCDRAFPRLSYLKRHEQHCCSLSAKWTQKDDTLASSFSMDSTVAFSPKSKIDYKKDFIDSNTKSKVAVVWCTKPAIMLNEKYLPKNSQEKASNTFSCISQNSDNENIGVSNISSICTSSIITLPQPLEIKGNEKKLYCYTSAGLVSKPAVFSASLSTSSHTNHLDVKQLSKSDAKVGGGMQCIVTSMIGNKKKSEGKRKVGDDDVAEAVERVVKHKKNFNEKKSYSDNGCKRVEVCFPKKSKDMLNDKESTLKCNITSSNLKNEKSIDNSKNKLQTKVPIHTIVSLNSDINTSIPSKLDACNSHANQNFKNVTMNLPLETTKPKIPAPITSISEVSIQRAKINNEKPSCKISTSICVVPSSYVTNNTLGKCNIRSNDSSALKILKDSTNTNPPIPNISISLVSIKPVSVPALPPMPVVSRTEEGASADIKNSQADESLEKTNSLSKNPLPKIPVKLHIPVCNSEETIKKNNNTEENIEDDGVNGQGNVWFEEKMYSFVEEELRQLGDPVTEDKLRASDEESVQRMEDKTKKVMDNKEKENPKSKDADTFTDSSGEIITEDVFSYIENELMRLDAMDDIEPLNTSSGELSSSLSLNSSVNDSGFCPSGMKTPDSSQRSRKYSESSCALSVDDDWSFLSRKGSLQDITASSDNLLDLNTDDLRPRGRRSTFSEFNRPKKPTKPRLRRFSISDSHGTLNMEESPGEEPLLCLKVLGSLKMEASDHSCRKKVKVNENSDLKDKNDELCKVTEKSAAKTSNTNASVLSPDHNKKDRSEPKQSSSSTPKIESDIQSTPENCNINSICNNSVSIKEYKAQIRKETIKDFSKKRLVTQDYLKDFNELYPKKSKNLEQKKASIKTPLGRIEDDDETEIDKQLRCEIEKDFTVSPKNELCQKYLSPKVVDKESNDLKNILNVQIPLTHVQLSKKHYEVMSPTSPNISDSKSNEGNLEISVSVHNQPSSPILQKIEPFHYQCTPPNRNKIKQRTSPITSPISPASPKNSTIGLGDQYSWMPIVPHRTPVSSKTTAAMSVATASNAYIYTTPPSFHSSSSSTVTLEETPSPSVSISSISSNSNQSLTCQKLQRNCQINEPYDNPTFSDKDDTNHFNKNNLYDEYLKTYLQNLNDKDADASIPSFYLTEKSVIQSDLYPCKIDSTDTSKSQKGKGSIFLKIPNKAQKPKNLNPNLGVINSKNDKENNFFTSPIDFLNTIDSRSSKCLNASTNIDKVDFPTPLKGFDFPCSPDGKEDTCEMVKGDLNNVQNLKDKNEIPIDDSRDKYDENLEENEMDTKQPSVHIQVRTGALAEQRGKSRAILSKLSQPLMHAGLQRHSKVETKVILIRTGLNSPDSPKDNEIEDFNCFPDRILGENYDRKFSAENLLYKSNTQASHYIENDFKDDTKLNSNLMFPKFENLDRKIHSNIPNDNNFVGKPDIENERCIGSDNIEKENKDHTYTTNTNSTNENKSKCLKTSYDNAINESDLNMINVNKCIDSEKDINAKKSSKKKLSKKDHKKAVVSELIKEKESIVANDITIKKEKIDLPNKADNLKNIKDGDNINDMNINKIASDESCGKNDFSFCNETEKCLKPLLENDEAIVPAPHAVSSDISVSMDETCSSKNVTPINDIKSTSKTKSLFGKQSCSKASDWKNKNLEKSKLNNKEHSKCSLDSLHRTLNKSTAFIGSNLESVTIKTEPESFYDNNSTPAFGFDSLKSVKIKSEPLDDYQSQSDSLPYSNFDAINIKPEPFYESQNTQASFISNNLNGIKIKSEPSMYESDIFEDTWDQNVGNFKCVTKLVEGTAMIRAAIRKKKYNAARLKRNNLTKGRRKKAEKKKSANLSKRPKCKSSMKENTKNKYFSYSRAGEIFDPNNLSTASSDALMAGITVHCTPEGVTLKLNCVENMDNESLKFGSSHLDMNKSSQANSFTKSKENFLTSSPSKNNPKFKDNYPKVTIASNNDSSECVKSMNNESYISENLCLKENKCNQTQSVAKSKENVVNSPSKNKSKCNNDPVKSTDISDGIEYTDIKSLNFESPCLKVDKLNRSKNFGTTNNNLGTTIVTNKDLSEGKEGIDDKSSKLDLNKSKEAQNNGKSKASFVEINPSKIKSKCKDDYHDSAIANNSVLDCMKDITSTSLKLENSSLNVNKCSLAQSMAKIKENFVVTTQLKDKPECNTYPRNVLENKKASDGIKNVSESLEFESLCTKESKSNELKNIVKTKDKIIEMTSRMKPKFKHDQKFVHVNKGNLSDCIENTENECLKSERSDLEEIKSNGSNIFDRCKDNFVLTSNKEDTKCKNDYPDTFVASNNDLTDGQAGISEKSQQILVSINKSTKSSKKILDENVTITDSYEEIENTITEPFNPPKSVLELFDDFESLESYEEPGKAITESVNPSKSVLELFDDFESLLGSMEDGDPEAKLLSKCKFDNPVTQPKEHGANTITLNGSSGSSTIENCSKPNNKGLLSNSTANNSTNTDVNSPVIKKPADISFHNNFLPSESLPSNVSQNIDKNIAKSKPQKIENCKFDLNSKLNQIVSTESCIKNRLSYSQNVSSNQKNMHIENISEKNKIAHEKCISTNKSSSHAGKFSNQNGVNFASNEVQINYKMPNTVNKGKLSMSNRNHGNVSCDYIGKKSRRKSLFENKACQSNSNTNYVYSRNLISKRDCNVNYKDWKNKQKFNSKNNYDMKNCDLSKTYDFKKDKNNNEFEHDHNYNSKRFRRKRKYRDLKVDYTKNENLFRNSNISCTKEIINPYQNPNQRNKLKNTFRDRFICSPQINANISKKNIIEGLQKEECGTTKEIDTKEFAVERESYSKESIYTIYQEKNVIAVSKTSILLNKNTKGKSNVPFEPENVSVKIDTCKDDSSGNIETINTKKFKVNKQNKKVSLDNKVYPGAVFESFDPENLDSDFINANAYQPEKVSLADPDTCMKSNVTTSKAHISENPKSLESEQNSSIESAEKTGKILTIGKENSMESPKHVSIVNSMNDNPQSSPDSPHFGLIHKLAQTSSNSGYTKIVVKKVRSSSIDRKKNPGLLSTTLKKNINQKDEMLGNQLKVKNDAGLDKDISNFDREDLILTKPIPAIERNMDFANRNMNNVKSNLSKGDSTADCEDGLKSSSNVKQNEVSNRLSKISNDPVNSNNESKMSPLENLEARDDEQLPKVNNECAKLEKNKINFIDSTKGNEYEYTESCSLISMDVISKDKIGYSNVNKNISFVHTFLPAPEEKVETEKTYNIPRSSSNDTEHRNNGVLHQPKCNSNMISNQQPLDLRLERSEIPYGPDGSRLTGFSYSVDLNTGLVNVISTDQPEYTANTQSDVLMEKEINSIDELAIAPVYTVQTLDNYAAPAVVSEGPFIMPVYSVCESKAQPNNSQVMQIYSYNAEDFAVGYNSKSIYSSASSISSVLTPNISINNSVLNNDRSLVVPVYSIASNNINISNSQGLGESSAILETTPTFPVYLLNSFDSSNSLPCAPISTIYTGNILDESMNNFPSEPVYGPHIMPIYSVETESHLNSTTFGVKSLSSENENVKLHNLEVSDLSSQNSNGADIVVNVEYIENITKSLDQERLKENSDVLIKKNSDNFEYFIEKGSTGISKSIIENKNPNVESLREYNYEGSITEIGSLDTEITNMEYPESLVDLGTLDYGDNIKSETEDDESSNTDIGSNHGGSEGGNSMDFMLLDSMTHADQLPFRCEFCGRLFKHKRSRDRHVKLHTGDKKYKCCHCEAAFSRSDHLKIHMKTHDTQKPYQCSVCNRGYNTAAALTAHMQNHKAKLTAHALNQLLKDHGAQETPDANTLNSLLKESSHSPADPAAFSQLLKEASHANPSPEGSSHPLGHLLLRESPTDHHHTLNHFLGDPPKEQLDSPRGGGIEQRSAVASPVIASPSPGRENCSPAASPVSSIPCLICNVTCRNHTHLQRHMSRHHSEESGDRPASRGGSGISSTGGVSTPSTPSPRPPSSLSSPRLPIPNPFMFLVGGKLSCIYCSRDGFLSLEALQLHIQSQHGSLLNGDNREMASTLNLPSPLGSSLGAGGLNLNNMSPLAPSSSRGVTCELCGARVNGVPALQRHVVTAHTFTDLLARAAEGVFCAQCLLPFSNPGALAEHIKLVHASPVLSAVLNKRPPSPPSEGPTDLSKKTRRCDNLSDLPANTLLCSQCNAPFTNFEAFRRHLKTHLESNDHVGSSMSGSQQLICPECRLPLTSENALEAHLATHLGATCTEYGCQACLKLFQKPDELQKHLMDIHAHHLYRCALCKEMFDSKVSIQVHFAVKHSNECKVHKCTRCSLIFRTQSEFEAHVRSSHLRLPNGEGGNTLGNGNSSNGMYRCLLCTLSLSSEAELAAHVSTHQRQFQCSLCDDAFHVEFLLDKHMQSAHNSELNGNIPQPENLAKSRRSPLKKELKCDICDSDFTSEIALLGHRKQAHNIKTNSINNNNTTDPSALSLFCAYCSEACKSRADLEIHMKSHQSSGGRHKCNICDELCPSAGFLAQHKLSHIKVLSGNTCAVCREPLTSEHQFTSHQNEHHPAPLPQPCVVCRQTLVTDIEVSVHARFHSAKTTVQATVTSAILNSTLHSPTIFTTATTASHTNSESKSRNSSSPQISPRLRCPECNVKLETPEEAEAHAQIHQSQQKQNSSARTYQCIKCQESFASESEIEAHVASHLLHEGSTHECHLCRGTFDTPLRLQCHLIEHTFEGCGSFTCYMCSSVFTTAARLQQHMVEHGLAARPYDCHHCHQKFFFRAELENHALSHPESTDGSCRECLANYPDLPRFHNRCSWPLLSTTAEGTTASSQISPARPTQNGSPPHGEIEASTNGHSNQEEDHAQEEDLQP